MIFTLVSRKFITEQATGGGTQEVTLQGGAEVNLYNTAKLLQDKGHDVIVIQQDIGEKVNSYKGINIKYVDIPENINGKMRNIYFNCKWKRKAPKESIIHIQTPAEYIPLYHDINTVNQPGINWNSPKRLPIQKYLLKSLLRKGALVRSSDNSFLTYVQAEWPRFASQVFPIPNGVDTDRFKPNNKDIDVDIKCENQKSIILFPRNLNGTHGTFLFLRSLVKLKKKGCSFKAIMLGDDETSVGKKAKSIVRKNDLGSDIIFAGHIDNKKMVKYYNISNVAVIPTPYSEGSSISCLEALSCGTPVVTTDVGGLKEIIYQDVVDGGIKCKPDSNKISEKISKIINNSEMNKRMGINGRKRVKKYYSKNRWRTDMSNFFDRVLSTSRSQ